jgi:hypothetical protein
MLRKILDYNIQQKLKKKKFKKKREFSMEVI